MKKNKVIALALALGMVSGNIGLAYAANDGSDPDTSWIMVDDDDEDGSGETDNASSSYTLPAEYQTIRRANNTMFVGDERVVQKGVNGVWTVTNGKKVLTKNPVDEIIEYGTKPKANTDKKPAEYQTIRRPNKDMLEGEEKLVQKGVNGEWTLINGKWTLIQAPVDEIIEYGTKKPANEERMEIPYKTIRRANNTMPEGTERVVQAGVKGYSIKDKNGVWVRKQEPVDEIIEYGTKKVSDKDLMIIPFKTIRRANPSMPVGFEKVVQKGVNGYSLKDKNGVWVRKMDPTDEIIEYGTKEVDEEDLMIIPFKTIRRANPDMYEGEERLIQSGVNGYSIKDSNGVWVRQADPTDEIIEYGTKKKSLIFNPDGENLPGPFNSIPKAGNINPKTGIAGVAGVMGTLAAAVTAVIYSKKR